MKVVSLESKYDLFMVLQSILDACSVNCINSSKASAIQHNFGFFGMFCYIFPRLLSVVASLRAAL